MNFYKQAIVTDKGLRTQVKCLAGQNPRIMRMAIGSGTPLNDEDIPLMDGLVDEVMDIPITETVSSETDPYVSICGILDCADVESSFEASELGLFIEGEDGGEVLYCYTYSERSELIPAGRSALATMQYVINTLFSRTAKIEMATVQNRNKKPLSIKRGKKQE